MIFVSANDLLIFTDIADANIRPGTTGDTLQFMESVTSNMQVVAVSDHVQWSDTATVASELLAGLSDTLLFSEHTVPRDISVDISEVFFMWDELGLPLGGHFHEVLDFSESLVVHSTHPVADTVLFTDVVRVQLESVRRWTDGLAFTTNVSAVRINQLSTDIASSPIELSENTTCTLIDATETLSLDNPKFGDSDSTNYQRVNVTTLGYENIIFGAGRVPVRAKKMEFDFITEQELVKLQAFMRRNLGVPVTLVDMYGVSRSVIFQNPEAEGAQVGINSFATTLDLYVL